MTYFVTGATDFIGRFLVERLLQREGQVAVLVRPGSREKLSEQIERWTAEEVGDGASARIVPVVGDLSELMLGVSEEDRERLRGEIDHFIHLAAI